MTKAEFLAQEQLDIQKEYKELRKQKTQRDKAIEALCSKYSYSKYVIESLIYRDDYYKTESTQLALKKLKTVAIAIAS